MKFLTARWENLCLLNYECPREVLLPRVPKGTELDLWNDKALVSVVGFMFTNTRLLGIPVPFHRTFEEVNLRFYVKRIGPDQKLRRAVTFVRELVPRAAIATVARLVYNEPYLAVPMSHRITNDPSRGGEVQYRFRIGDSGYAIEAECEGPARPLVSGSEAEFITEHYWGYTAQRDGGTIEYQVEHPPWLVWENPQCRFFGDVEKLYGTEFVDVLARPPRSAFVAVGSDVAVYPGKKI